MTLRQSNPKRKNIPKADEDHKFSHCSVATSPNILLLCYVDLRDLARERRPGNTRRAKPLGIPRPITPASSSSISFALLATSLLPCSRIAALPLALITKTLPRESTAGYRVNHNEGSSNGPLTMATAILTLQVTRRSPVGDGYPSDTLLVRPPISGSFDDPSTE